MIARKNKIQYLLIKELLEHGEINLRLPDGFELSIGITQEGKNGDAIKSDNYCWIVGSQDDREISIDSFKLGLRFRDHNNIIMLDTEIDAHGDSVKHVDIV